MSVEPDDLIADWKWIQSEEDADPVSAAILAVGWAVMELLREEVTP